MKKVMLLSAVALMSASVFVSCGPSEEEQKKMADSLNAAWSKSLNEMANTMMDTTAKADTAAAPATETTTTEEKK